MSGDEGGDELNLGLLCFIAYRSMESRVFAALAAAGFDDLAQGRVAARIGPNGTRVTDLAEQAGITKQTAAFLVNQLERAGYVRRTPDPADARARLVRMAPVERPPSRSPGPPRPRWRRSGRGTSAGRAPASCGAT